MSRTLYDRDHHVRFQPLSTRSVSPQPKTLRALSVCAACVLLGLLLATLYITPPDYRIEPAIRPPQEPPSRLASSDNSQQSGNHAPPPHPPPKESQSNKRPLYQNMADRLRSSWTQWAPNHESAHGDSQTPAGMAKGGLPPSAHPHTPRARIAKATVLTGEGINDIWERALHTHAVHNAAHGYTMYVDRQELLPDVWSKPAWLLHIILGELARPAAERLDWLVWIDGDTVIINPHIPLEVFLPPSGWNDVQLLATYDWNGLNNGVLPIRVSQWSVELLSAVLAYPLLQPAADLPFRDQSAMDAILQLPKFARRVVRVPQRWFNAYPGELNETIDEFQSRRGDLLVHFAGFPDREELMAHWLARAEDEDANWAVDIKATSYPEEIRSFWADQDAQRRRRDDDSRAAVHRAEAFVGQVVAGLAEHGAQLPAAELNRVNETMQALQLDMLDPDITWNASAVVERLEYARAAAKGLLAHIHQVDRALAKEAHHAIFEAEQALFDAGAGVQGSPKAKSVEDLVHMVKVALSLDVMNAQNVRDQIRELGERVRALGLNQEGEGMEDGGGGGREEHEAKKATTGGA